MDLQILAFILIGFLAGGIGSMVGLGGGIIMVPALTILMQIDMKSAISASLITLIATSVMSVSVFAKKDMIHMKFGMILMVTTIIGSFAGSLIGVNMAPRVLMVLFGGLMIFAAYTMYTRMRFAKDQRSYSDQKPEQEERWDISGVVPGTDDGKIQYYKASHVGKSSVFSLFAGCISGMLGVGGGIIQVPLMHVLSGIPMKVATATSSFIIGFTGLAGALTYVMYAEFDLRMTAALVLGTMGGSYAGSKAAIHVQTRVLVWLMIVLLLVSALRLFIKVWTNP